MSLVMRKLDFCICENKAADQLRDNREADHRLCFSYTDFFTGIKIALYEPRHEETGFLHMRKQSCRSASR